MMRNEQLMPVYCPKCSALTFLFKVNETEFLLLSCKGESWEHHNCFHVDKQAIAGSPEIQKLLHPDQDNKELPFVFKKSLTGGKEKKFTTGIVTSISVDEYGKNILTTITPDNIQLKIKALFDITEVYTGVVIDISALKKIGKNKYRLAELKVKDVSNHVVEPKGLSKEYYQVVISSKDQEQLEGFGSRLIDFFSSKNSIIYSVVPLEIQMVNNEPAFRRCITVFPNDELLEQIESFAVPEAIFISIKQIKPVQ